MPSSDFDIYQTESGYMAVTNEVRRAILNALAKKERQLPELVKITKRAKPTLSSVHMKELLDQKLVEEVAHPTDKRKKIYRLCAKRIGSSSLPVDQLRDAVKQYASVQPQLLQLSRQPLVFGLDAIAAAPADTPDEVVRVQARRLGALCAGMFSAASTRESVTALAALLERESLARALKLDLEARMLEVELGDALPPGVPDARLACLLGGFVEGLVQRGAVATTHVGGRRVQMRLPE